MYEILKIFDFVCDILFFYFNILFLIFLCRYVVLVLLPAMTNPQNLRLLYRKNMQYDGDCYDAK